MNKSRLRCPTCNFDMECKVEDESRKLIAIIYCVNNRCFDYGVKYEKTLKDYDGNNKS